MQSRRGTWLIVLSSIFFAVMAVLARHLSKQVPAFQLSFIRFAIGSVAMGLVFIARREGPDLRHPRKLLLRGLFGTGAVLTYFVAIQRLGSGPATVLNYCSPLYAALFASLFLNERPSGPARVGLGIATIGAALVTWATGEFSTPLEPGLGGLAGIASGALGGAAITVIRSLRHDTNAFTVFSAFSGVGLLISTPLVFGVVGWVPLDGELAWQCLVMGLLSIGGQLLFTWGMGYTTAASGSATTQLVPVLAWVLGVSVLHEPLGLLSALGALLCVGGVLLGLWKPTGPLVRQSPSTATADEQR
ncbi:MAG: DMT family transporter [Myxococcaceae bacterium]|nr:DMT family transporter [Myxococcaceae bacterium]